GAVVLAQLGLEVVVDLLGAKPRPAPPVSIREQLRPARAPPLERADDLEGDWVLDHLGPPHPSLRRIIEYDCRRLKRDVLLADRGEADASVVVCVLLAADPEHPDVEQAHGAGQNLLKAHLIALQIGGHPATKLRKQSGEEQHALELLTVPVLAPARVVQVLLATGRIYSGRLEMAARVRADPDVPPRRRDRQVAQALEGLRLAQPPPVLAHVYEAASAPDPPEARLRAIRAPDPVCHPWRMPLITAVRSVKVRAHPWRSNAVARPRTAAPRTSSLLLARPTASPAGRHPWRRSAARSRVARRSAVRRGRRARTLCAGALPNAARD